MINLMIHHKVKDFAAWKAAFDSAFMFRKDNGETSFRIYRNFRDPNDLTLWFEWESADQAEKFASNKDLFQQMKVAGVEGEPQISIMQEVHAMRRTAAD